MRMPPPAHLAKPRPQLPSFRDHDYAERTLTGLGVPPARPEMDSREVTTDSLLNEVAERAAKLRAAEAANVAKDAEIAELRLEAAAKEQPEKFDAVAYFTRVQVIALKILLPLAAIAAAVGVTLGIYSKTAIEPKVDRTVDKQAQQDKKAVTVEDRVLALEQYSRAHLKWEHCMDAERDSALERGTGHKVETSHDDVQWVEQNAPKPAPRVLWRLPPWSINKDQGCGAEPAPPSTPSL